MDNKYKIINYLGKNIGKSFTMHELSKRLNIPYATLYRTINDISKLIIKENVGRAITIGLNINNPAIASYLVVGSEEEKSDYIQKQQMIRKIISELNTSKIVLLFGSYAKGTSTEKSDIDVMVIGKDGNKDISFSKYELLYKKKINPIFITKKEFELMLKEKEENVGKQALKWHIILNNSNDFWGCVLNAI